MATDPKKRKYHYSERDKVDAYLLNQITKHVKPDEFGSLARDLDIDEAVYSNITVPKDRVYKVCNFVSFSECKFSKKTI